MFALVHWAIWLWGRAEHPGVFFRAMRLWGGASIRLLGMVISRTLDLETVSLVAHVTARIVTPL